MRKKTSAPRECTAPKLMDFEWSSMLFSSLSKPSQSMRMVLAIRLFEFRSRKDICSMYAKLLLCTLYACEAALARGNPKNRGKPQESANQRARYFKRQALSQAVVANSNMSRSYRKYLAREGPGSRLVLLVLKWLKGHSNFKACRVFSIDILQSDSFLCWPTDVHNREAFACELTHSRLATIIVNVSGTFEFCPSCESPIALVRSWK